MLEKPLEEITESVDIQTPAKVVLFNDDYHTFEEVIYQLIKAIHCDYEKARALTYQVHFNGKAIVFSGELARCIEVSSILEEIQLLTQIEY